MKHFKIIILYIYIFILLPSVAKSQSRAFIEWKYLELTNIQNDATLSADNYRNAELVADSLIFNQDENYPNAHFFLELARAYRINNENGLQAFSLLRQHCLYPNDSLNKIAINDFVESCLRMMIPKEKAIYIYKNANKAGNFKSFSDKLNLLINSSILLYDKKTDAFLIRYIDYYKSLNRMPSSQVLQWLFLTNIKLSENKKAEVLRLNKDKKLLNKWQVDNLKLQKRILMRAEHFYAKEGAKGEAKYYLSEYKKLKLNIFNRIQVLWRKMVLVF